MANLTFIPNASSKGSAGLSLTMDDIPEDVRNDVEEVYKALKTNPGRMRVSFATLAELNTYIAQVTAYCQLRPEGEIRFRKSPSRGLPATTMDFRITDKQTPAEETTEEIREAVTAVKATAAKK